jgi:hypothetical protein
MRKIRFNSTEINFQKAEKNFLIPFLSIYVPQVCARAVALVEDSCCFRYAANAIEAPLASRHRAVRRFQKTD